MTTYLFRVAQASIDTFRAATIADSLADLTPDTYTTDDREQGERIAKRLGIDVTVEIEYRYWTDNGDDSLFAADWDEAKAKFNAMFAPNLLADGASGWIEDVDGFRHNVGR